MGLFSANAVPEFVSLGNGLVGLPVFEPADPTGRGYAYIPGNASPIGTIAPTRIPPTDTPKTANLAPEGYYDAQSGTQIYLNLSQTSSNSAGATGGTSSATQNLASGSGNTETGVALWVLLAVIAGFLLLGR